MKGISVAAFGDPEVMALVDLAEPHPGHGQVVVRLRAVGVNPVDCYIRSGLYPLKPHLPYTPGFDAAGEVEAVGSGVSRFKAGDRVYTAWTLSGAYAEKALCDQAQLQPLPAELSFAQGAAVGIPYATAYRALFQKARAQAAETVLIHGASGGVGLAAVQLARAAGLRVIGSAGSREGRELVSAQGVHQVLDHGDPAHFAQLLALTEGRGVDVILEMLANVNLGRDLPVLATGGRVVVIGSRGAVEIDPRGIMGRDATILGMSLFNATDQELASIHAALGAGLANGTLRPVVSRELPLAAAALAHHAVLEASTLGKIVLLP